MDIKIRNISPQVISEIDKIAKQGGCKKSLQEKKAAILSKSKTAVFFCGIIKVS